MTDKVLARIVAGLGLLGLAGVVALSVAAGAARADEPGPVLPTYGEGQACEQAWVQSAPNDPRVSMKRGLGSVMYYAWVQAQCNGPDAKFPNGAAVAGSGLEPVLAPWQQLPVGGAR
ncbi:hypothetical protein DS6A_44 [Mycobacterium phage DS6A]|uniref:Uncharacterized protein n=1 Tax=Mycobacterium phage DS6A TaxID=45764 RepID=G8I4F4_9CAUD|nr:hypothetical protein DS6A_44 [Mycobacterium phage DS6A]AER47598.1 hypothetical protein DS6A_44 [Mycobacterium phage DS6A]